jgi:uncharacterized protein YciI
MRFGPGACEYRRLMAEWIYIIHPPRENFAATMTEAEQAVWSRHWERAKRLYLEGSIVLMGPYLGSNNLGICIFEAQDEAAARKFMEQDPAIASGIGRGDLQPYRVSLLRGRDEEWVKRDLAEDEPAPADGK